jgi:hypothetical protein
MTILSPPHIQHYHIYLKKFFLGKEEAHSMFRLFGMGDPWAQHFLRPIHPKTFFNIIGAIV